MAAKHPRSFCDIPELEESEQSFSIPLRPRIEDANDMSERYGAFSLSVDMSDDSEW